MDKRVALVTSFTFSFFSFFFFSSRFPQSMNCSFNGLELELSGGGGEENQREEK